MKIQLERIPSCRNRQTISVGGRDAQQTLVPTWLLLYLGANPQTTHHRHLLQCYVRIDMQIPRIVAKVHLGLHGFIHPQRERQRRNPNPEITSPILFLHQPRLGILEYMTTEADQRAQMSINDSISMDAHASYVL
jgi:hypothetical protein